MGAHAPPAALLDRGTLSEVTTVPDKVRDYRARTLPYQGDGLGQPPGGRRDGGRRRDSKAFEVAEDIAGHLPWCQAQGLRATCRCRSTEATPALGYALGQNGAGGRRGGLTPDGGGSEGSVARCGQREVHHLYGGRWPRSH